MVTFKDMKGKILITDSLFIGSEHEQKLISAGYEIERLDVPSATEEQLVEAIKGKVGYILGGIEKVSNKVIDAGDSLKAIVFTGIGYKDFINDPEYATKKGIAIANTPDAPTYAVAEWAITMALAINRNIFDLGRLGEKQFMTSKGIEGQRIGIVGMGRIGKQIASMISVFRPLSISYYSKHIHADTGYSFLDLQSLMKESDIIFICVSKDAGENFIGAEELASMKDGALLVSFVARGIVNQEALLVELQSGRIRAVTDGSIKDPKAKDLPLGTYYSFNGSNAFNTFIEIKTCSDGATQSMINLLETGEDKNRVN